MSDMGACERCGAPGSLHAYWGPVLCSDCAQYLAVELDRRDCWPEVPWDDEDRVLLDG